MSDFEGFGLSPAITRSLATLGFETPTPIQQEAIPLAMQGLDVVGLAQTGTGKTAAFGLPLANRLMNHGTKPASKTVRALVLAPTRELVNQIAVNIRRFTRKTHLKVSSVVGGASINAQCRDLQRGTDILIATPGRLLDLHKRKALTLEHCEFLVLDEADQMLDLGFIVPLKQIEKLLNPVRQTMLFSATMPKQIEDLANTFLKDPVRVETAPAGKAADKVEQRVHYVTNRGKPALLREMLENDGEGLSLVFARTKHGAEKLKDFLVNAGLSAGSIHGNKSQGQRDRAIRGFKEGKIQILVATDVAARGIDVPGVARVFNYNLPEVPEAYVHRIGRTARAGASGEAIAFCAPEESNLLRAIQRVMKIEIPVANPEARQEMAKEAAEAAPQRRRGQRKPHHRGQGPKGSRSEQRQDRGPNRGQDQRQGGRPENGERPAEGREQNKSRKPAGRPQKPARIKSAANKPGKPQNRRNSQKQRAS